MKKRAYPAKKHYKALYAMEKADFLIEQNVDFNSVEWKESLKNKSPEEIAELVEYVYKKKAQQLPNIKKLIILLGIMSFILVFLFVFLLFLANSITRKSSYKHSCTKISSPVYSIP